MWQIYGQDHLLRQLEPSLAQDRLSHAYLLTGPPHVGKMTLALSLAQAVNCLQGLGAPCGSCSQCSRIANHLHADVRVVGVTSDQSDESRSSRTVIGIDDIKEVLRSVNLNPFEGSKSVIILDGGESMSTAAANALLKTLEEPPPNVLFLLLAASEEAVLPTIRSRCQVFALLPLSKAAMTERLVSDRQVTPEEAERLYRFSRGCLGWAIQALDDFQVLEQRQAEVERMQEAQDAGLETRFAYANEIASLFGSNRDAARDLLALWLRWWRDLLLIKEGASEYLHNIDQADALRAQAAGLTTPQIVDFIRRLMKTMAALDDNASARLALEVLMLNLPMEAARI
ncbi:MAG: DNA polymerase III subunit delta' [SAR202 cluster bacterium Io17-Chloro-G9]|nr:MAG: DNA polymerase III subunit delta' [SAR202 cluster bacterium Io17-Chloro-G9]